MHMCSRCRAAFREQYVMFICNYILIEPLIYCVQAMRIEL